MQLNFNSLLSTVATLFLLLIVGFIAAKTHLIDDKSSKTLSNFVLKIGNPFFIISSVINTEYSITNLKQGFLTLGAGVVIHILMSAIAFLICYKIKDQNERKVSEFTMIFGNVGFIGFPILNSLLGPIGLFLGAFFSTSYNIFTWTWGLSIFSRERDDIKMSAKKIFFNFGTVPGMIGLVLYCFKSFLQIPTFVYSGASYLSNICTPVTMIITGALLSRITLSKIFLTPKVYLICVIKLIAMPIIICLLANIFGLSDMWVIFFTTMAAMPSGTTVSMFSTIHDVAPEYAAQIVGTTSLLAMGTIPLVLWVAQEIMMLI